MSDWECPACGRGCTFCGHEHVAATSAAGIQSTAAAKEMARLAGVKCCTCAPDGTPHEWLMCPIHRKGTK